MQKCWLIFLVVRTVVRTVVTVTDLIMVVAAVAGVVTDRQSASSDHQHRPNQGGHHLPQRQHQLTLSERMREGLPPAEWEEDGQ